MFVGKRWDFGVHFEVDDVIAVLNCDKACEFLAAKGYSLREKKAERGFFKHASKLDDKLALD